MRNKKVLLCTLLIFLIQGCAKKIHLTKAVNCEEAGSFALYAALSSNAYLDKKPLYDVSELGWYKVDIEGNRLDIKNPSHSGWFTGLAFDIWEHEEKPESIVAFRGTDGWWDYVVANLAVPISPQYKSANKKFKEYLDRSDRTVISTGHSLGGGLALSVSAQHPNIDARAFDSSPRIFDGFGNDPPKANRTQVFETGEALQKVRKVWSLKIDEIILQKDIYYTEYSSGNGQHKIEILAPGLIRQGADCNADAKYLRDKYFSGT